MLTQELSAVNVWNVPENRIEATAAYDINGYNAAILALTASSRAGYLLVAFSSNKVKEGKTVNITTLVVYDEKNEWKQVADAEAAAIVTRLFVSVDGMRVLTNCQSAGEQKKALDLFDMSNFGEGKIKKIASLMPETDTRFCYLTDDGETVCVGLASVDGVTFFRPCGGPRIISEPCDVIQLYTDHDAYMKT